MKVQIAGPTSDSSPSRRHVFWFACFFSTVALLSSLMLMARMMHCRKEQSSRRRSALDF
jgi:hypothetical protein